MSDSRTETKPDIANAAAEVVRAIRQKGPHPGYHDFMWQKLVREWPTLATALKRLLDATPEPVAMFLADLERAATLEEVLHIAQQATESQDVVHVTLGVPLMTPSETRRLNRAVHAKWHALGGAPYTLPAEEDAGGLE